MAGGDVGAVVGFMALFVVGFVAAIGGLDLLIEDRLDQRHRRHRTDIARLR